MGWEKPAKDDRAEQKCCLGLLYYAEALGSTKRPVCLGLRHAPGEPVDLDQRTPIPEGVGGVKYLCLGHSAYDRLPYSQQQRLQQMSRQKSVGAEAEAGADASSAGEAPHPVHTHLPYCEGVEIIVSEMVQDAAAAVEDEHEAHAAAVAALAGAARPVHEAHLEEAGRHTAPRPQQPAAEAPRPPVGGARPLAADGASAGSRARPAQGPMGEPRSVLGTILSATGLTNVDGAYLERFGTRFMHVAERNVMRMRSTMSSAYEVAVRAITNDDGAPDS